MWPTRLALLLVVWVLFGQFVEHAMLTPHFGAWYGQSSLTVVLIVSVTALGACWIATGRPVPNDWS